MSDKKDGNNEFPSIADELRNIADKENASNTNNNSNNTFNSLNKSENNRGLNNGLNKDANSNNKISGRENKSINNPINNPANNNRNVNSNTNNSTNTNSTIKSTFNKNEDINKNIGSNSNQNETSNTSSNFSYKLNQESSSSNNNESNLNNSGIDNSNSNNSNNNSNDDNNEDDFIAEIYGDKKNKDKKNKEKKKSKLRFILYIFLFLILIGVISVVSGGIYIYKLSKELPSTEEFGKFKYTEPMVVYDAKGTVIAELGSERRYPISIDEMPIYIPRAVVAVEDGRFYEHSGIDPMGIMRAMVTNIKAGRMVEGGSTLTQQLVKVLYLSPERKLKRKVKEVIIAYRLDRDLSKEKILELYLNQVNFGRGAYGIQAAAINYFGKKVDELTIAEAAMIAGIPKGPSIYAPHLNMKKSVQRRNHVLKRMHELNYITDEEYENARTETVKLVEAIPLKLRYAGYFMDYVHKFLEEELKITDAQNEGLKIYTTLNLDYQIAAEKALIKNLIEIGKREGYKGPIGTLYDESAQSREGDETGNDEVIDNSTLKPVPLDNNVPSYLKDYGYLKAVVTNSEKNEVEIKLADNSTGVIKLNLTRWAHPNGERQTDLTTVLHVDDVIYVKKHEKQEGVYLLQQNLDLEGAMVSVNPQTGEILAMVGGMSYNKSFFNRAVQGKRQVGSTFKPIVYATAYESGYMPMSKFYDSPVIEESDNETEKDWRPKNFDGTFKGAMTLQKALQTSNNSITIKVAQKIGIRKIVRYAKNFGFTGQIPNDLSVSIGSLSASPLEMAYAYSTFANQGTRPSKPFFVTRVADIDNNTLYNFYPPEHVKVLEKDSASLITDNLIRVVRNGGAWRTRNAVDRIIGGKTGTSNESKDCWFAGVLPNLVTITWMGYDDFRKMGDYAVGGNTAQLAFIDYYKDINQILPYALFNKPEGVSYFKTDSVTNEITDAVTGNFSFAIYPVDDKDNVKELKYEK